MMRCSFNVRLYEASVSALDLVTKRLEIVGLVTFSADIDGDVFLLSAREWSIFRGLPVLIILAQTLGFSGHSPGNAVGYRYCEAENIA